MANIDTWQDNSLILFSPDSTSTSLISRFPIFPRSSVLCLSLLDLFSSASLNHRLSPHTMNGCSLSRRLPSQIKHQMISKAKELFCSLRASPSEAGPSVRRCVSIAHQLLPQLPASNQTRLRGRSIIATKCQTICFGPICCSEGGRREGGRVGGRVGGREGGERVGGRKGGRNVFEGRDCWGRIERTK